MAGTMRAMVLHAPGQRLRQEERPIPEPGPEQVLLKVHACAVCRTDLHVVDGELTRPKLPLVPGHEIVATVVAAGARVEGFAPGLRVGVPWLGWSCGQCRFCRSGRENLCDTARFTGYDIDGGFAQYTVADARFCFPLPLSYRDVEAAPLMCAGLIGFRSLRMAGEGPRLGLYGFGAAAHILIQVARYQGRRVHAFTREGDAKGQAFARELGAVWAGGSDTLAPEPLDAAILFAPVGALVPAALKAVDKGGVVVCGGIHMSDIPSFPYSVLWEERVVRSVANLTRQDAMDFLALAPRVPVRTEVQVFPLSAANEALQALREGRVRGAAVLDMAVAE
ncbi:zinc-binding alcohol dehydrogenase family protein [Corallococcus sp. AB011P]|uniref:zinc-dependent alcohol dehydrogenase family protein n=1 Tax=unclassified Corallococcus TaxID=2685029 RepID=UPI000EA08E80|nr:MULTISPECIES: zinc-dependent alcohol dehydrogenase family protein [unclassified Corallococcus]RKG61153.1 zinc-binding alcohol dehydrogenase family protein [Corallococcus sp. AB011P]RKH79458.1 zinc-binding alcohol dehydrogenase family protein [Corallococcus sp. AB045]